MGVEEKLPAGILLTSRYARDRRMRRIAPVSVIPAVVAVSVSLWIKPIDELRAGASGPMH